MNDDELCEYCGLPEYDCICVVYCPECGEDNDADNVMCDLCGAELYP